MTIGQAHTAAPDLEVKSVSSRRERTTLWREVRGSHLFAGMHAFQDFLTVGGGHVFYLAADPSHWLVLGRWKEGSGIGMIWSFKAGEDEAAALLSAAIERATAAGLESLVTRPLSFTQAATYLLAGFIPWREIAIFEMEPGSPPVKPARVLPGGVALRSLRPGDTSRVLAMDERAFDDFWSLDRYTMNGIAHAAELNTFHLAASESGVVGYTIAGITAGRGYLQRLGVDPEFQGRGIGKALAAWSLWWMSRNGARVLTVNTQRDNLRAIRLYEGLGFKQTSAEKFLFAREVKVA